MIVLETQVRCLDSEGSDNLPGDEHGEYLDRLRLGMSPGGTSEVLGQVRDPTTCLEISKEK